MKLSPTFYQSENVVQVAKSLLGKELHTHLRGIHTSGIITEVEAYAGRDDKACHANNGLRSKRTEIMYRAGGVAYVYLCYGIHHLFNVVTNVDGMADAVLIRAIQPLDGIESMLKRRKLSAAEYRLTSGPGTLTAALGIKTKEHYAADLQGDQIWIEDAPKVGDNYIVTSKRIGVDYAEEDALKPWRFYIKDNPWISKK
ncbi:3-methyladenine DNA glycosylase [Roseivirga sp. 4D4]|uniref:DNA-3-methyladenine glycosylase n=1 Tax=Roseivirga sp. 4D4 TaxID=1889784 RepID=UPI0008532C99|nr:DNA-3-methyladenine glycosylase [Roseivirga sp. 4D4]OEK00826.1 3-methyladenine DNA glycosylase [Roseivirga sp. 4D4]